MIIYYLDMFAFVVSVVFLLGLCTNTVKVTVDTDKSFYDRLLLVVLATLWTKELFNKQGWFDLNYTIRIFIAN